MQLNELSRARLAKLIADLDAIRTGFAALANIEEGPGAPAAGPGLKAAEERAARLRYAAECCDDAAGIARDAMN